MLGDLPGVLEPNIAARLVDAAERVEDVNRNLMVAKHSPY
jgi:hypothetical protein